MSKNLRTSQQTRSRVCVGERWIYCDSFVASEYINISMINRLKFFRLIKNIHKFIFEIFDFDLSAMFLILK